MEEDFDSLIETLTGRRQLPQLLGGMKTRHETLIALQFVEYLVQAQGLRPAQDATVKCREANAQYQAHIHVARLADDSFLQHAAGFHEHGEKESISDFLRAALLSAAAAPLQDGA